MITEENFDINLCKGRKTKNNPTFYTNKQLRNFLIERELPYSGTKTQMTKRIENYMNNKPFPIDCGGAGDCLFSVIARILHELTGKKCNANTVRKLTAKSVNKDNVNTILENYLIEYKNYEEDFMWDPIKINECSSVIEKSKELKSIIKTDGYTYEGDDVTLTLLANSSIFKEYELGIVIITDTCQISFIQDIPYKPKINAIIYNIGNYHWQLVGARVDKKKKLLFTEEELDKIFENFDTEWFE